MSAILAILTLYRLKSEPDDIGRNVRSIVKYGGKMACVKISLNAAFAVTGV
jgi:hypothetical protein